MTIVVIFDATEDIASSGPFNIHYFVHFVVAVLFESTYMNLDNRCIIVGFDI